MCCRAPDRQPRLIWYGFLMDKEQNLFFKEPKEHFLAMSVLERTLKTKERRQQHKSLRASMVLAISIAITM